VWSVGVKNVSSFAGVNDRIGAFWHWWSSELTGLAPIELRQLMAQRQVRVVAQLGAGGGKVLHGVRKEVWRRDKLKQGHPLAEGALTAADVVPIMRAQLKASPRSTLVVRLPFQDCLRRRAKIPSRAEGHLLGMLALDIERVTPFRRDQVYFDGFVADRSLMDGWVEVEQVIVERARVDPVLGELRALGLTVGRVECWNREGTAPMPVNVLQQPEMPRGEIRTGRMLTVALALAVLLLGTAVVWQDFDRYDRALGTVDASVRASRQELAALRKTHERLDAARSQAGRLLARKQDQPAAVVVVDELARRMPDDSWLNSLHIEPQAIDLFGFSKSATALTSALQARTGARAPWSQARLTAPITFDTGRKVEQFSMRLNRASVSPGDALAPAPISGTE
jgi:general secretion pathway protein L